MAGAFVERTRNARLNRALFTLFRAAKIPVVLLGGEPPSVEFPCDLVGVNRIVRGRRVRMSFDVRRPGAAAAGLVQHGELIGDVALRLMLLRLGYEASAKGVLDYRRHPPSEVFLDLPSDDGGSKRKQRKGRRP